VKNSLEYSLSEKCHKQQKKGRTRAKSTVHEYLEKNIPSDLNVKEQGSGEQPTRSRKNPTSPFLSPRTKSSREKTTKLNIDSEVYFFFCKKNKREKVVLKIEKDGFSWTGKPSQQVCKDRELIKGCFDGVEVFGFETIKEFKANKVSDNFTLVMEDDEIVFKTPQVEDIIQAIAVVMENKELARPKKKGKKSKKKDQEEEESPEPEPKKKKKKNQSVEDEPEPKKKKNMKNPESEPKDISPQEDDKPKKREDDNYEVDDEYREPDKENKKRDIEQYENKEETPKKKKKKSNDEE